MVTLASPRMILRPPCAADARPLLEIHEHPDVVKHVVVAAPLGGLTAAWRNIATMLGHWQLRGFGSWVLVDRESNQVAGRVGFFYPEGWRGIELGWVMRRDLWGRGLATEAARTALEWAWLATEIDEVISIVRSDNVRSVRVAEKIGQILERSEEIDGVTNLVYSAKRPSGVDLQEIVKGRVWTDRGDWRSQRYGKAPFHGHGEQLCDLQSASWHWPPPLLERRLRDQC